MGPSLGVICSHHKHTETGYHGFPGWLVGVISFVGLRQHLPAMVFIRFDS